jgi:hypothetical protein
VVKVDDDGKGLSELVDDCGTADDAELDTLVDDLIDSVPLPREQPEDGVPYTGRFEADSKAELGQVLRDMQGQAKRAQAQFKLNTDTDYYLCLCFVSREQKREFLTRLVLGDLGERFLSGVEVAKRLGVALTPVDYRPHEGKADKGLSELILEDDEYGIGFE